VSERAGRTGDLALMTLVVAGTTTALALFLTRTPHTSWLGLAALGAVAAGMAEIVTRGVRPDVRFAETAAAVALAGLMAPALTRWGHPPFDRDALLQISAGVPLGVAAAWLTRRGRVCAAGPEVLIGIAMMAAALGGAAVLFELLGGRGGYASLGVAGLAAGFGNGALVRGARAGHAAVGAIIVFGLPRTLAVGQMRALSFSDMCIGIAVLGGPGLLGFHLSTRTRARAARRAAAAALPEARLRDAAGSTTPPAP
jgi:hypothetical protein